MQRRPEAKFFKMTMLLVIALLFTTMAWADDLVLTEADDGRQVQLEASQILVVELNSKLGAGYTWMTKNLDETVLKRVGEAEVIEPDQLGEPEREILRFVGVSPGQTPLELELVRPWDKVEPLATFSVKIISQGAYSGIYKAPAAPKGVEIRSEEIYAPGLPQSFNWCDQGGCTPIRNQGSCGSCWAFATVGAFESAILIKDGVEKDLSEQYLVSCNSDGWGCGGGWWAHDYHIDKHISQENDAGAVYEEDFPYRASDVACNGPHDHYEKLDDWGYVDEQTSVPSVAKLKQAIYDHGPLSVGVCSGSAMSSYRGGIFTSNCTSINHGVVLTGWDDDGGYFHMRNSWGTGWGEDGYMRIKYGASRIGYNASYVVYQGGNTGIAAPSNLEAQIASPTQVELIWQDNSDNETAFHIEKRVGSGQFEPLASVGVNQTAYTDKTVSAGETCTYRVQASNADGVSNYSNPATVTIPIDGETVFEDDFEMDKQWQVNPGGGDSATTGMWERANPQGTTHYGNTYQLDNSASGIKCLVTGAQAGANAGSYDIDNGDTTIVSPVINLPAAADDIVLQFNYTLAHMNNATADDYLRVSVVSGSTTQVVLDERGDADIREGEWLQFTASVSEFAGQSIKLLVEAADAGSASLVEAAIDDIHIIAVNPGANPDDPPVIDDIVYPGCISEMCTASLVATATDPVDVNCDPVVSILDKVAVRHQFGQRGCSCLEDLTGV